MSRNMAYVVLAALLAAGCASAPEVADEAPAAAPAVAAAASPATASPATASPATIVPDTVLDANDLIAHTPARPICRDTLRPNSNVHVTRCMSAADWKIWDQIEAKNAAEIVRMMQGSAYR